MNIRIIIATALASLAFAAEPTPAPDYKALYEKANEAARLWKEKAAELETKLAAFREQEQARVRQEIATDQRETDAEAIRRDRLQRNVRTIREVKTNQPEFYGKTFTIEGTAEPSSYYNWGYRDAAQTHYAFRLHDGSGDFATAYLPRAKGEALHKSALEQGTVTAAFKVRIQRYSTTTKVGRVNFTEYHDTPADLLVEMVEAPRLPR